MTYIIRIIMILVFSCSALIKMYDYKNTLDLFQAITRFPESIVHLLINIIVIFELAAAILFYMNLHCTLFAKYFIVLLFMFFITAGIIMALTDNNNCGCFGTIVFIKPVHSIAKNIILLLLFHFLVKNSKRKRHA